MVGSGPTASGEQSVERRIVTVLFCDLVGFTSLSEGLDAEDVATIQDAYFAMVRETVGRYGGRLEKFIGDAAMAVFGLPRARDDDVERGVRAGLAIVGGIQQIGARLGLDDSVLRVRVGINTGEAIAAAGGPDEGRVTGDTVNTAARLQTAADPMTVYVGEATALAVADVADLESAGGLELKGKAEPVPAWVVRGVRAEASRERAMGALRAPTLGRQAELSALAKAWERVAKVGVDRWLIAAPPGVGKSRLLREFADQVAAKHPQAVIWRTRCRPDVVSPFEPIARLLRDAITGDAEAALGAALKSAGTPELRARVVVDAVMSVLGSGSREGAGLEDRDALFDAWLEALDGLAGGAPQTWLVEDVHWAGGDVLAFLELAGEHRPAAGGRLLIATCRPSLLETNPDWTADDGTGRHQLRLDTLPATDAAALVRALVGDALPGELVQQIAQRSDGNCLFIEELLRTWVSVGTLVPSTAGGWHLTVSAEEIPLPTSVQSIYAAQLDDLPPDARLLARRASVAGRRFPVNALGSLGVGGGLDPLQRRDLIAGPLPEPVVGDAFAYRHALLRDAGYASLARAERARLHVRLARWLEGAAGDRTDELAEAIAGHYAAALESAPALAREVDEGLDRATTQALAADWYERAGTAALDLAAHDAARTLYRRSIDLSTSDNEIGAAHRWELLGDATAYAADMDEGAADFQTAIDLYRQAVAASGDPGARSTAISGLARAAYALGEVWYQQLRFAEERDLGASVIGEFPDLDDASLSRMLVTRAKGALGAGGPSLEVNKDLEHAVALAGSAGDERLHLDAYHVLVVAQSESGQGDPADWEKIEGMARAIGNWPKAISAAINAALWAVDVEPERVPALTNRAREMAIARGRTEDAGWADYAASEAAFMLGDWDEAMKVGSRAIEMGLANAYRRLTVRTWHVLVPIALVRGDIATLQRAADWYDALTGEFPDSPYARLMRPSQDLSFGQAGVRPPPIVEVEPRIVSYADEPGGPSWTAAADLVFRHWLDTGEADGAARALAAMSAALPRYATVSKLGRGTYHLLHGRLAFAHGNAEEARAAAAEALNLFRTSKAAWWMAKAIRLSQRAGNDDPGLEREVSDIERRLGAVAPTA